MAATSDTTRDPRPITYADQLAQKRQREESWAAIARAFAQLLRLWIAPPAIILARRTHDLGWIRVSHAFFRCAWANIPASWRDSLDDWDVWSIRTREFRNQRRNVARIRLALRIVLTARWISPRLAPIAVKLADRLFTDEMREELERAREAS